MLRAGALLWTAALATALALVWEVEAQEEASDYGARVDIWLKEFKQAVRVAEDTVLHLRLQKGEFSASLDEDGAEPFELGAAERAQLLAVFPEDATRQTVSDEDWAARVREHGRGASAHVDSACPVNGENHLEKAVVEVFEALRGSPWKAMLNIGGLYGGKHGEGAHLPDDPTVELLRHVPDARVLCWKCGDFAEVTRVGSLASRFEAWEADLTADPSPPQGFRDLDLLRLDFLPAGQSCQVLGRLLRRGVRPRMVAMLVLSQVPPPFQYVPLAPERHPQPLFSCSLAAASEVLARHDLFLLRLTGPYALFVRRDAWRSPLPLSELDCYRGAGVWGDKALPLPFVREWLFQPVDKVLPRLWGNLTLLYEAGGFGGAPFTLAV